MGVLMYYQLSLGATYFAANVAHKMRIQLSSAYIWKERNFSSATNCEGLEDWAIPRNRTNSRNYQLNITVQSQNPTRNFIVWKYYARGRGVEEWMRNWKMSNLVSVLQFTIAKNILTGREIWGKFKISVGIISEATTMEWVALEAPIFIIFTSNFFYFTFSSFS